MDNNKNKKSVKFQGDMLNFCDFIQVFVFTRNHHLNRYIHQEASLSKRFRYIRRLSSDLTNSNRLDVFICPYCHTCFIVVDFHFILFAP